MDQRLKEILDNLDKTRIGLDDILPFSCNQCGKCCIDRKDLLLNPRDLYRMAKELDISIKEWIDLYGECFLGDDSRIPILRIRSKGSIKKCPLMKNHSCMVHKAKPTVCALFPLGRGIAYQKKSDGRLSTDNPELFYIYMNPGCGEQAGTMTVAEWLQKFDIPLRDEYFFQWSKLLNDLSLFLCKLEKSMDGDAMQLVWNMVFSILYTEYDTSKDFMIQYEENVETLRRHMEAITQLGGGLV